MRNSTLMAKTPLKRRVRLKAHKRLKPVSPRIRRRNDRWRNIVLARAEYLRNTYGFMVCEYSGEMIHRLSSMGENLNDGWGHHINGNRNDCSWDNCFIVKYKYHRIITDNNLKVKQERFEGMK